jgi:hypothetical protein
MLPSGPADQDFLKHPNNSKHSGPPGLTHFSEPSFATPRKVLAATDPDPGRLLWIRWAADGG